MGASSSHDSYNKRQMMDGAFSDWLDTTMENNGIRGRDLARRLGVSDGAVSRWRSGAAKPSASTTAKIGNLLGVDPVRLILTAGHIDPADAPGIEPLSVPSPTARRQKAIDAFAAIKGLTQEQRDKLLEVYDEVTQDEHGK